jgi:hypothetical protein
MDIVFFVSFIMIIALSIRGLSIAKELKQMIKYDKSTLSLHYHIQNYVFSSDYGELPISTSEAQNLYSKCTQNLRAMILIVFINVVLVFAFG